MATQPRRKRKMEAGSQHEQAILWILEMFSDPARENRAKEIDAPTLQAWAMFQQYRVDNKSKREFMEKFYKPLYAKEKPEDSRAILGVETSPQVLSSSQPKSPAIADPKPSSPEVALSEVQSFRAPTAPPPKFKKHDIGWDEKLKGYVVRVLLQRTHDDTRFEAISKDLAGVETGYGATEREAMDAVKVSLQARLTQLRDDNAGRIPFTEIVCVRKFDAKIKFCLIRIEPAKDVGIVPPEKQ